MFYATANKDIWEAVSIPAHEINQAKQELIAHPIEESLLESLLLNDETAQIIERPHLARIRRIDKNVCLNLKRLYGYRCQICGQLITLPYGGQYHVIDAHHIDPFSTSLNNNFSNIVILCPNHHRIIHAYNPHFTVENQRIRLRKRIQRQVKLEPTFITDTIHEATISDLFHR